jgi:hypothetical protein
MVAITLFFAIGYYYEKPAHPSPGFNDYTIIVFVFWGLGLAGLVIAWWKEALGATFSLLSFVIFNILAFVNPNAEASYSPVLLIFLIPSILYLIWWKIALKSNSAN